MSIYEGIANGSVILQLPVSKKIPLPADPSVFFFPSSFKYFYWFQNKKSFENVFSFFGMKDNIKKQPLCLIHSNPREKEQKKIPYQNIIMTWKSNGLLGG